MKCVRCGTEIKLGDKVCLGCGFEVGKKFVKENESETLESLMQMPAEEVEEKDDAEEIEINDNIEQIEEINGEKVSIDNKIVKESNETFKRKSEKKYMLPIILLVMIVLVVVICLIVGGIKCYINNSNAKSDDQPNDIPKEIINHPTTEFVFDNRFMFKLNDLWHEKDEKNSVNQIKNITFEKDISKFKIVKYQFDENTLKQYLNYIGIETSDQVENNSTKYEHIINNQTEEYIIVEKEYIYVISFINLENEEINGIMKTIYYYK